jgi:hypothetical protein
MHRPLLQRFAKTSNGAASPFAGWFGEFGLEWIAVNVNRNSALHFMCLLSLVSLCCNIWWHRHLFDNIHERGAGWTITDYC